MHAPGELLRVGDRELWIEREGRGPRLVLLGGLGPAGSHAVFHPFFSALADAYEVIYVDLFGRGRSGQPQRLDELDFATDARDVTKLLEALGPSHVYGFSYGGLLALQVALDKPLLVRTLTLANTLHSPEMWQLNHQNINRELQNQFPELWDEIEALHARGVASTAPELQRLFAAAFRLVRFHDPDNAAKLAHLFEPGARNAALYPVFCGADVDFIIGGKVPAIPDFRPRLRELAMPVLVVAGRYDRALYPRLQRGFGKVLMLEKSGSFAHVEEPDALFTALRAHAAAPGATVSRRSY